MKPAYFSISRAIVTHPDHWIIKLVKLRTEKGIQDHTSCVSPCTEFSC